MCSFFCRKDYHQGWISKKLESVLTNSMAVLTPCAHFVYWLDLVKTVDTVILSEKRVMSVKVIHMYFGIHMYFLKIHAKNPCIWRKIHIYSEIYMYFFKNTYVFQNTYVFFTKYICICMHGWKIHRFSNFLKKWCHVFC